MHFYAWKNGLKTGKHFFNKFYFYLIDNNNLGMYYLRARPAADAIKFTLDVEALLRDAGDIEIAKRNLKTVYNMPVQKS